MTPPDKGNETQGIAVNQGTNTEHWADIFQPEIADSKLNVSFCGEEDLIRSVETKLVLQQFNKMYDGEKKSSDSAEVVDDSLLLK